MARNSRGWLTRVWLKLFILVVAAVVSGSYAQGAMSDSCGSRYGLGVNYPGLALRYGVSDEFALEARGQMSLDNPDIDASAYGGRLYYFFGDYGRIFPYITAEGDAGRYDDGKIQASGYGVGVFIGFEYFLHERISVQADFGPAYVSMSGKAVSVSDAHFVTNLGITFYVGDLRQ